MITTTASDPDLSCLFLSAPSCNCFVSASPPSKDRKQLGLQLEESCRDQKLLRAKKFEIKGATSRCRRAHLISSQSAATHLINKWTNPRATVITFKLFCFLPLSQHGYWVCFLCFLAVATVGPIVCWVSIRTGVGPSFTYWGNIYWTDKERPFSQQSTEQEN